MTPPRFLFLTINNACPLQCGYCHYWKRPERGCSPLATKVQILQDFRELAGAGAAVVICGGESTLQWTFYLQIAEACRGLGLRCLSVTNGITIHSPERAEQLVQRGPSELTVSIDHAEPEHHDRLRGVAGTHRRAERAVRLLLAARGGRAAPRIYVMAVVSEQNYRALPDLYRYVLQDLGADKLKLNFLQPTFGLNPGHSDVHFASGAIRQPTESLRVIRDCAAEHGITYNPEWLRVVGIYLDSVAKQRASLARGWQHTSGTSEVICNSGERNIMVDAHDCAGLCFDYSSFPAQQLAPGGRYEPGNLARFWENAHWRAKMRGCRKFCGISHSVRGAPATLGAGT